MNFLPRLLLLMLCCTQINGYAWGRLGHRLTAAVAAEHLTPEAKLSVDLILHHQSMVDVSDWADRIRPTKKYLNWHYATVQHGLLQTQQTQKYGDLYGALFYCLHVLNPGAQVTPEARNIALKLLIHLVGDAHQPLHVGNGLDRGGNLCRVAWYHRSKPVNFHSIWDTFLVKKTLAANPLLVEQGLHISGKKIHAWQATPIKEWLIESSNLLVTIYPKEVDHHAYCSYRPKYLKLHDLPHLQQQYSKKMTKIVAQRIWQGGIRLAGLLNRLFDKNYLIFLEHLPPQQVFLK